MDQFFSVDLNARNKVVTVTLPEPQILSHAVYPKLDNLDVGWLREIKGDDLNQSFNLLREEFIKEARREDVFSKAKAHAQEVMATMMGPIVTGMNGAYKLRISFRTVNTNKEMAVQDEFTDLDQ